MTDKYITKKIHKDKDAKAKKLGLTFNEYVDHLESLVEQGRTKEQDDLNSTVQSLVGTVASLTEALKHQRYLTDSLTKDKAEQSKMISQQIEITTKIINAFGSNMEFIEALKKEITQ
jgi:KaiC/GvpD/RAD55 family RecA-like ATPase